MTFKKYVEKYKPLTYNGFTLRRNSNGILEYINHKKSCKKINK